MRIELQTKKDKKAPKEHQLST